MEGEMKQEKRTLLCLRSCPYGIPQNKLRDPPTLPQWPCCSASHLPRIEAHNMYICQLHALQWQGLRDARKKKTTKN